MTGTELERLIFFFSIVLFVVNAAKTYRRCVAAQPEQRVTVPLRPPPTRGCHTKRRVATTTCTKAKAGRCFMPIPRKTCYVATEKATTTGLRLPIEACNRHPTPSVVAHAFNTERFFVYFNWRVNLNNHPALREAQRRERNSRRPPPAPLTFFPPPPSVGRSMATTTFSPVVTATTAAEEPPIVFPHKAIDSREDVQRPTAFTADEEGKRQHSDGKCCPLVDFIKRRRAEKKTSSKGKAGTPAHCKGEPLPLPTRRPADSTAQHPLSFSPALQSHSAMHVHDVGGLLQFVDAVIVVECVDCLLLRRLHEWNRR